MFLSKFFQMGLEIVGEFNPQLMREWQGRLRWRNLLLVLLPSFLIQVLILGQYAIDLPILGPANRYCTAPPSVDYGQPMCEASVTGGWVVNWSLFWSDIFRDLSFVLIWVAIAGGVYLLVADLSKESQRGTLNFLRMSPQSSQQLFLGKLLGVPVLIYGAMLSALPLHSFAALQTQFALGKVLMFYAAFAATTFCFYAAALWFSLVTRKLQGFQPWLALGIVFIVLMIGHANTGHDGHALDWVGLFNPSNGLRYLIDVPQDHFRYYSIFNISQQSDLQWWYLPVGRSAYRYGVFAIANALGLGLGFWQLLQRRFQSPAASIISKGQSYWLTLCLMVGTVGFDLQQEGYHHNFKGEPTLVPGPESWPVVDYEPPLRTALEHFRSVVPISLVLGLLLMGLLLPGSQALLDWLRYRRQQGKRGFGLFQDLLHHDNSPPILAFVVNGCLMFLVLALGFAVQSQVAPVLHQAELWIVVGLCGLLLLNGLLVLQGLAISEFTHWPWMAIAILLGISAGVPAALGMLNIQPGTMGGSLWLLTVASQRVIPFASVGKVFLAFSVHLTCFAVLSIGLTRRLRHLGQSEWKALMEQQSSRSDLSSNHRRLVIGS